MARAKTPPLRITMDDIVACGHCARGVRRFFNDHGLDFRLFMREGGIPAKALTATKDALALDVVERTKARRKASRSNG